MNKIINKQKNIKDKKNSEYDNINKNYESNDEQIECKNTECRQKENNKKTNNRKHMKFLKIVLGILVAALIIGVLIYFVPIMKNLTTSEGKIEFKNKIEHSGFLGMLTLFGLQVAQIFLFLIPGEPIEIVAGMCYGAFWGTVFILVSAGLISTGIFFLVRMLGKKFVYEFSDEEKVKKIENSKLFQDPKKTEIIMLILFLLPGTPKDLLVYIAGLLPIKPSRFIVISTLARIPSIVSSTYAGEKILAGNFKMAALIYAAIIAIVTLFIFIVNKLDKNKVAEEALKTIK